MGGITYFSAPTKKLPFKIQCLPEQPEYMG